MAPVEVAERARVPGPVDLSVVVTVTAGGAQVERCLGDLASQVDPPRFEILVPVDPSVEGVEAWRAGHPAVRFPVVRSVGSRSRGREGDPAAAHLAYDLRRAAGLAAARAPIVALTEDNARPDPDWCRSLVEAHRRLPHAAIGGAIDNASDRTLNRAVYLSDFGRYQRPLEEGPARYLSDVNVSYKRAALGRVSHSWRGTYHETAVHDALVAAGETLWLCPELVVRQERLPLGVAEALRERFAWGRLYAGKRVLEVGRPRRLALALLSPLLPPLLLARQLRSGLGRGRAAGPFLRAFPALVLLESAWSVGEVVGYWSGRPVSG